VFQFLRPLKYFRRTRVLNGIYIWNCILQVVKDLRDKDIQFCWEPKVVVKSNERLKDMPTYPTETCMDQMEAKR
jgi:hypothetical protein